MNINFGDYDKVGENDDYKHKIILDPLESGLLLPPIYLRLKPEKVKKKKFEVNEKNMKDAVWRPNIPIDPKMSDNDYKAVIAWWFAEARSNEEYSKHIAEKYAAMKPTFLISFVAESKQWLFNHAGMVKGRRKNIGRTLETYLNFKLGVDKYLKPGYRSFDLKE